MEGEIVSVTGGTMAKKGINQDTTASATKSGLAVNIEKLKNSGRAPRMPARESTVETVKSLVVQRIPEDLPVRALNCNDQCCPHEVCKGGANAFIQ